MHGKREQELAKAVARTAGPLVGDVADFDPLLQLIGDARLVLILLEELPLQDLRALIRVDRDELRPVRDVPEDRVRLGERASVVEDERRQAQRGVEVTEYLRAVRAVDHRQLDRLVLEAEVREKKSHLVAIARDR